jgi:hypothetical protein
MSSVSALDEVVRMRTAFPSSLFLTEMLLQLKGTRTGVHDSELMLMTWNSKGAGMLSPA